MSTPYEVQLLQDLKPLCGRLQDALGRGLEAASDFLQGQGLDDRERDWLRHHIARAVAQKHLLGIEGELEGWRVGRPRANNGPLSLMGPRRTAVRILHDNHGQIPAPGSNRARCAFYAQGLLGADEPIPTIGGQRLIASWYAPTVDIPEVAVNIFRPSGTFKFGSPGKADIAFPLPHEADDLDALEWTSNDEGIDLPIPDEGESGAEPADG